MENYYFELIEESALPRPPKEGMNVDYARALFATLRTHAAEWRQLRIRAGDFHEALDQLGKLSSLGVKLRKAVLEGSAPGLHGHVDGFSHIPEGDIAGYLEPLRAISGEARQLIEDDETLGRVHFQLVDSLTEAQRRGLGLVVATM